jgi:cell division septation protein DedD
MPSEGPVDWYWLTLVVGTAVVAFGLGSASTMWWFASTAPNAALGQYGVVLAGGGPAPMGLAAGAGLGTAERSSPAAAQIAGSVGLAAPAVPPNALPPTARPDSATGPAPFIAAAPNPGQAGTAAGSGTGQAVSSAAAPAGGRSANMPQVPDPAVPPATQGGNFSLQLGAFLDAANAKLLSGRLAAEGYAPMSIDAPDGYGHVWHYVRLGGFADERTASLTASEILERTGIAAIIVRGSATRAGG